MILTFDLTKSHPYSIVECKNDRRIGFIGEYFVSGEEKPLQSRATFDHDIT